MTTFGVGIDALTAGSAGVDRRRARIVPVVDAASPQGGLLVAVIEKPLPR